MIKRIKFVLKYFGNTDLELEYAFRLNNLLRGVDFTKDLSLSIGNWAGSFTFFYVLVKTLMDAKPKQILELGLGESSKVLVNYKRLKGATISIREHDELWLESWEKRNGKCPDVILHPLTSCNFKNVEVPCYEGFYINSSYDLVIVDAPFGSKKSHSRVDLLIQIQKKPELFNNTIILYDDINRRGEWNTFHKMAKILSRHRIQIFGGSKGVGLLVPQSKSMELSI